MVDLSMYKRSGVTKKEIGTVVPSEWRPQCYYDTAEHISDRCRGRFRIDSQTLVWDLLPPCENCPFRNKATSDEYHATLNEQLKRLVLDMDGIRNQESIINERMGKAVEQKEDVTDDRSKSG